MPIWLLGAFGAVRNAAKAASAWATANTTHLLAVILSISALWGLYERHEAAKYHRALDACSAARKSDQAQWNRQVAAAKAATAAAQQKGKEASDDAQQLHEQLEADTGEFDAWKRAHRVQPAPRPATPASTGSGIDPAVHAESPALPAVATDGIVLSDADADNWKRNADYAQACYKLGQDLIAKGLAVPAK